MADPSSDFTIELVDLDRYFIPPMTLEGKYESPPPPKGDPELERSISQSVDTAAQQNGLERIQTTRRESHSIKPGRGIVFYGGMPGTDILDWTTITYAAASAAAMMVFLKDTLDAILKWRELRNGRQIKVKFGEELILVKDEETAKKLRKLIAEAQKRHSR